MNTANNQPVTSVPPDWSVPEIIPIHSNLDHLRNELQRLQVIVRRAVLVVRRPETLGGILINDEEALALAMRTDLLDEWPPADERHTELHKFDALIAELRKQIDAAVDAARKPAEDGTRRALQLASLRDEFQLEPDEADIVLIALAAAVSADYGSLFGYLQKEGSQSEPTINLVLNLLDGSAETRLARRRYFMPAATLVRCRLIEIHPGRDEREVPLLRQTIRLDRALVAFLLGQPMPEGAVPATSPRELDKLCVDNASRDRLWELIKRLHDERNAVVHFVGRSAESLREAAEAVAAKCGLLHFTLDLTKAGADADSIPKAVRNARLWGAALIVRGAEAHGAESEAIREAEAILWSALELNRGRVFLLGPEGAFGKVSSGVRYWSIEIGAPGFEGRKELWGTELGEASAVDVDPARLASAFRFGTPHIRQAIHLAQGLAAQRGEAPSTDDFITAGRELTVPQIARFARRIRPGGRQWHDIVLPPDKMQQLKQIEARMEYRQQVLGEWGFGERLTRGKGLIVLFTGPSGTGKTLAAEILASELRLDLYQIDLSGVMSKYIGESEKHLCEIFEAAAQSQAMLFFDEADALFGKRTEVKDAHDRYANIETDYLLQRVENYEGMVVLATNLQGNLDEAFLRRIHEVVEFPPPDEASRAAIFRAHLPEKVTAVSDRKLAFLARQFELNGGNIGNIALSAAFLAASDPAREPKQIKIDDLVRATAAELRKEGRLCLQRDFGEYHKFLVPQAPAAQPQNAGEQQSPS